MRRRALAVVCAGLVLAGGAWAQGASEAELDALRREIESSRERVGAHEAEERALFDRLEDLDKRLAELSREVRARAGDERRARAALAEIETETRRLSRELARTRAAMSSRVVALYKAGELGPLRALFTSDSVRDLLRRMTTLRTLVRVDVDLVTRFERDRAAYAASRADAVRASERHARAAAALRERRAALAHDRAAKGELLTEVRKHRSAERALLIELERAARALETTLVELGDTAQKHEGWLAKADFAAARGRLPAPVKAPVTRGYGREVDAQYRTETFHSGVEFGAAAGDSVRAIARAEVRYAGWFRGYGRMVILDQGDAYFTVFGHLEEIFVEVGERVSAGDTLGTVGDTGSLSGPALYFELRRSGEALDPGDWLAPAALAGRR